MSKYHDMMEHIKVTDEMEERVLHGIEDYFSAKTPDRKSTGIRTKHWKKWAAFLSAAAAVALIFSLGHLTLRQQKNQEGEVEMALALAPNLCESREALEEAVGFSMPEIENIPFSVTEITYRDLETTGEITYQGEEDCLVLRKSMGEEDNSGIYTTFDEIKIIEIEKIYVTLKGENGKYELASWQDGGFSYSLRSETARTQAEFETMIQEMIVS